MLTIAGIKILVEKYKEHRNEWKLVVSKAIKFLTDRLKVHTRYINNLVNKLIIL